MVLSGIVTGISYFLQVIYYALLAYCLLSWIFPPYHRIMQFLGRFIDPLLRPIRRVMFRLFPRMPIDLSALVGFLALRLIQQLLWQLYYLIR
ncbi:hypothetical protein FACS1894196_3380 [Clostridia bacterium]|nr:hypothetical protein FACS1894196_3380 [Clostridia bacterium]